MKKGENKIDILELAESFDFEKLSSQQKSFVLNSISKEEYEDIRLKVQELKKQFNKTKAPILNENIKLSISQEILEQNKRTSILAIRIPLYLFAASIVILITIYFSFLKNNNDIKTEKMEQLIVEKTDTIVTIFHDTIFVEVNSHFEKIPVQNDQNKTVDVFCQSDICPSEAINISNMNYKKSIAAEPELNNYMVSIP
jgi:hypothetical protein